ncbi:hypothetical protein [Bacillus sp. CECT 9360]|uniref:hypothetical protein n=1 Tax=Bacillus sp. CECT 9360 TaxID=2845821 RepID=UPI001E4C0A99|nr:hypothetical protein [Bacillus sp. CECT 9360]CAH0346401.1 hypothetical protein BCI9360_02735 [Bacillus sp. CECT 9360]
MTNQNEKKPAEKFNAKHQGGMGGHAGDSDTEFAAEENVQKIQREARQLADNSDQNS